MAVFELVYQRMEGPRRRPAAPAAAIALSELRSLRKRRIMKVATAIGGLLTFGVTFYIVLRSGILNDYLPAEFPLQRLPAVDASFFHRIFYQHDGSALYHLLLMITALFAGSGRIAEDLRSNALAIYLARPLTREDYLLGKILATVLPVGTVALGIPMFAWLVAALVDPAFLAAHLRTGLAILATGVLGSAYYSFAALFFSALVRSGRIAGLFFAGFVILSGAVRGILSVAFRGVNTAFLGFSSNFATVGGHLLGTAGERTPPLVPALLAMVVVITVGFVVARRRVRAVEVVQ